MQLMKNTLSLTTTLIPVPNLKSNYSNKYYKVYTNLGYWVQVNNSCCLLDQGVALTKGNPPARFVWVVLLYHGDAVNDRTHTQTQGTPGTVRGHRREVGLGVKGYRLVARVVTDHVTFATVDAHVFVDDCNHLLSVVQIIVGTDSREGQSHLVLCVCVCVCVQVFSSMYSTSMYIQNRSTPSFNHTTNSICTLSAGMGLVVLYAGLWTSGLYSFSGSTVFLYSATLISFSVR